MEKKMNKSEMVEKIRNAVAKQLRQPLANVTADKKLKDDLRADSLDVVELMMNLEEEYNITIADEDLTKMQTINDVADYIIKVMQ